MVNTYRVIPRVENLTQIYLKFDFHKPLKNARNSLFVLDVYAGDTMVWQTIPLKLDVYAEETWIKNWGAQYQARDNLKAA